MELDSVNRPRVQPIQMTSVHWHLGCGARWEATANARPSVGSREEGRAEQPSSRKSVPMLTGWKYRLCVYLLSLEQRLLSWS
jgi:hypothetical protein